MIEIHLWHSRTCDDELSLLRIQQAIMRATLAKPGSTPRAPMAVNNAQSYKLPLTSGTLHSVQLTLTAKAQRYLDFDLNAPTALLDKNLISPSNL